jgi:hypothetical protein
MYPGLDVLIGQSGVGALGLFILWRRWHEARRLQIEHGFPSTEYAPAGESALGNLQ